MKIIIPARIFLIILLLVAITPAQNAGGCSCPNITITGPLNALQAGEVMTFFAAAEGIESEDAAFDWSIDQGTIISGQGTSKIEVDTSGLEDVRVLVTATVVGACTHCENIATASGLVLARPESVLVDAFRQVPCDEFLARMDNFLNNLWDDPNATAYVFIYGTSGARRKAGVRIKNYVIKIKKFEPNRFVFVTGLAGNNKAYTELWLVPPGADASSIPIRNDIDIEPEPPVPTKPYILTGEYYDPIGGCSLYDPEYFASALNENPQSRGNIVIYETDRKLFQKKEKEILDTLTTNGVSRKRLRTFYVRVGDDETEKKIELWYLP